LGKTAEKSRSLERRQEKKPAVSQVVALLRKVNRRVRGAQVGLQEALGDIGFKVAAFRCERRRSGRFAGLEDWVTGDEVLEHDSPLASAERSG